jgi:hypothetical protein
MGKRKATRMALLKAGDTKGMQREISTLNQMVENLQVLLSREVDKNETLETKIANLEVSKTKTTKKSKSRKNTTKTKTTED